MVAKPKTKDKRCTTLQNLSKCRHKYNLILKSILLSGLLLLVLLEVAHLQKTDHHLQDLHQKYRHLQEIGPPLRIRDKIYDPAKGIGMYMIFDLTRQIEIIAKKENVKHKLDGASAFKFNPGIGLFSVAEGHGAVFDDTPMYVDEEAAILSI